MGEPKITHIKTELKSRERKRNRNIITKVKAVLKTKTSKFIAGRDRHKLN